MEYLVLYSVWWVISRALFGLMIGMALPKNNNHNPIVLAFLLGIPVLGDAGAVVVLGTLLVLWPIDKIETIKRRKLRYQEKQWNT